MNDENGTLTMSFPPNFPWRHLVIEGDEELNIAKLGQAAQVMDPRAPQANNDSEPQSSN